MSIVVSIMLSWAALSVAFYLTAQILPGVQLRSWSDTAVIAGVFGLLNTAFGWLLQALLSVASFGMLWVLSGVGLWLSNAILLAVADRMTQRLGLQGVGATLLFAAVLSLSSRLLGRFVPLG